MQALVLHPIVYASLTLNCISTSILNFISFHVFANIFLSILIEYRKPKNNGLTNLTHEHKIHFVGGIKICNVNAMRIHLVVIEILRLR